MCIGAKFFSCSAVIAAALLCIAIPASAATVPFEVEFTHSGTTPPKQELAHIFVLDRSWSMKGTTTTITELDGKQKSLNLWDALKQSLKTTIENTPNQTELRFLVIDGADSSTTSFLTFKKTWCEWNDFIVMSDEWRSERKINGLLDSLKAPKSKYSTTPLYDVLEVAFVKAWELTQAGKRVSVFVFSDGDNYGGKIEKEDELKQVLRNQEVPFKLPGKLSFLPIWLLSADSKPKPLLETEWQTPGTSPILATVVSSPSVGMVFDNPIKGQTDTVRLGFDFKVSDKIWSKMQNFSDEVLIYDSTGKRQVASHPVNLKDRVNRFYVNIDNKLLPADRDNVFLAQLACRFPENAYITCDKPDPVRITFAKVGEVSVSVFSPVGRTVKCGANGEDVRFVAMVNPTDAECKWNFGDGKFASMASATHRYDRPGVYEFSVEAKKDGLVSGSAKGTIIATNAFVSLERPLPKAVLGEKVVLRAKGEGPIARYVWSIAGKEQRGKDSPDGKSSELVWVPRLPDSTAIAVNAIMKGEMRPESDREEIVVEAKPYVRLDSPKPGFSVELGASLEVAASAVNVPSVVFKVYDVSRNVVATQRGSAIKDGCSSATVDIRSVGQYLVVAESADGLAKSDEVPVTITAEQLKIFVDAPQNGDRPKTSEGCKVAAHVTGSKALLEGCGGVAWEFNGIPLPNGSGKINDKCEMSVTWNVPDELGEKECVLRAFVLDKDGGKTSVCDEVTITPLVEGAIELDEPLNGKHVSFGEAFNLKAKTSGRVKGVTWFAEVGGVTTNIGTEKVCEYRVKHVGQKKAIVRIHAEAAMPGGVVRLSPVHTVVASCPDVDCSIKLPAPDGVARTSFGLNEAFDVQLDGDLIDVKWDVGNGPEPDDGSSVRHCKFDRYSEYTIKAFGKCPHCHEEFAAKPVTIKIERQLAVAKFDVVPAKSAYAVNGKVQLVDKSTGDIDKRIWRINGVVMPQFENKDKVDYGLPLKPDDLTFTLEVCDPDGNMAPPYSVPIRVRFGWWAIIIFFIAALCAVALARHILFGNDVLGLIVKTHVGSAPTKFLDEMLSAVDNTLAGYNVWQKVGLMTKVVVMLSRNKRLSLLVAELASEDSFGGERYESASRFGDLSFTFSFDGEVPNLSYDEGRFDYVTPREWRDKSPMEESAGEPNTRIVVLKDKRCKDPAMAYLYMLMRPRFPRSLFSFVFWSVVVTTIYLVFQFSVKYAV